MSQPSRLDRHLDHLPLFPLPGAVLFPDMHLPLHIFEPRYRTMVQHARSDGLPIAIGMIQEGKQKLERPTVYAIAGAGFIDSLKELPDGRFLINLVGQARIRILGEKQSSLPYRVVSAERLTDQPPQRDGARRAMDTLQRVIYGMHKEHPQAAGALTSAMSEKEGPGPVADAIAAVIHTDPLVRQSWLEDLDPVHRLSSIIEGLETFLAQSHEPSGPLN